MITVNETLFSKLVSGGEQGSLTIDGKYGGYVKAGAAFQDEDGKFKVELVEAEQPTPRVILDGHMYQHMPSESTNIIVIELKEALHKTFRVRDLFLRCEDIQDLRKKEVEHIDTGFEGLVYAGDPCKEGYYFSKKEHSEEQLQYMQDVLKTFSLDTIVGQDFDRIMFRRGQWISIGEYSIEPTCKITFNDIFVQGN